MTKEIKKFETGKTYFSRSICDHDCIFKFTVISRTEKTVTITNPMKKRNVRRKINIFDGEETCMPTGTYSMAPSLRASKVM